MRAAGDTGSNSRVDLFVGIIRDLARKHELARFHVGYFYSEVSKDALRRRILAGDEIAGLDARPPLDLTTLDATEHVVAMAGIHPYIKLLDEGADMIVGGRPTRRARRGRGCRSIIINVEAAPPIDSGACDRIGVGRRCSAAFVGPDS